MPCKYGRAPAEGWYRNEEEEKRAYVFPSVNEQSDFKGNGINFR
jgi:hypothetical protein